MFLIPFDSENTARTLPYLWSTLLGDRLCKRCVVAITLSTSHEALLAMVGTNEGKG
jgi:hypothetical protein